MKQAALVVLALIPASIAGPGIGSADASGYLSMARAKAKAKAKAYLSSLAHDVSDDSGGEYEVAAITVDCERLGRITVDCTGTQTFDVESTSDIDCDIHLRLRLQAGDRIRVFAGEPNCDD